MVEDLVKITRREYERARDTWDEKRKLSPQELPPQERMRYWREMAGKFHTHATTVMDLAQQKGVLVKYAEKGSRTLYTNSVTVKADTFLSYGVPGHSEYQPGSLLLIVDRSSHNDYEERYVMAYTDLCQRFEDLHFNSLVPWKKQKKRVVDNMLDCVNHHQSVGFGLSTLATLCASAYSLINLIPVLLNKSADVDLNSMIRGVLGVLIMFGGLKLMGYTTRNNLGNREDNPIRLNIKKDYEAIKILSSALGYRR